MAKNRKSTLELTDAQQNCPHPDENRKRYGAVNMPDGTPITPATVYCGACGVCLESDSPDGTDTLPGQPGTQVLN